jgi:Rod binding domain-containing protein
MLPKDGAAVYGKGTAGEMWKSLLAQEIADVMAERGGIGIADRMLGAHYAVSGKAAEADVASPSVTRAGQEDKTSGRPLVAPAVLEGMQRSLSQLLDGEMPPSNATPTHSTMKRG